MRHLLSKLIVVTFLVQSILLVCAYAEDGATPQKTVENGIMPAHYAMDPAIAESICIEDQARVDEKNSELACVNGNGRVGMEPPPINDTPLLKDIPRDITIITETNSIPGSESERVEPEAENRIDREYIEETEIPITLIDIPELESPEMSEEVIPIYANPPYAPNERYLLDKDNPHNTDVSSGSAFKASFVISSEEQDEEQEQAQTRAKEENKTPLLWVVLKELETWGLEEYDTLFSLASPFYLDR